jgi:hypothetical protein
MHAAVPPVEVADHADAVRGRGPDGKMDSGRAPDPDAVRAQFLERAIMRTFADQMQIEISEHPPITIRVVDLDRVTAAERKPQPIVRNLAPG